MTSFVGDWNFMLMTTVFYGLATKERKQYFKVIAINNKYIYIYKN